MLKAAGRVIFVYSELIDHRPSSPPGRINLLQCVSHNIVSNYNNRTAQNVN